MGLDGVEVVIAIEEAFDISITDEEASEVRTVGELKSLILRRLAIKETSVCWNQRAFHRLRRSAQELFGVERRRFRPELALEEIVPADERKVHWQQLHDSVGALAWPKLVWPRPLYLAVTWSISIFYVALVVGGAAMGGIWLALLSAAFGALVWVGLHSALRWVLKSFETSFPKHCQTVANLVPYVAASDPELSQHKAGKFTEPEVSALLTKILCEQLGIKASDFTDNSELVRDLGMG
jgi:acyl carrier protein